MLKGIVSYKWSRGKWSNAATLDTPGMFMALALVTLIGVALYGIVILTERAIVPADARVS